MLVGLDPGLPTGVDVGKMSSKDEKLSDNECSEKTRKSSSKRLEGCTVWT